MMEPHVPPDPATSSPAPTQASSVQGEEVARLAYTKWHTRCQPCDHQEQDWLEAEAELSHAAGLSRQLVEANERMAHLLAEQRDAQRRLLAEHPVSSILAVADTLSDAAPKLVQSLCGSLDWDVGVVWLLDRDAHLLRCVEVWHPPQVEIPAFEKDTLLRTFSSGIGLPGRVWASESMVRIPDVTTEANSPRKRIAAEEGLHGAVAFPVRNGVEFLGVLEFYSSEVREPDEQVREMMCSVGRQISQFIERRGAERQFLEQEHDRRTAKRIQQGLLPKSMPHLSGFEISGRSVAPHAVGGDCFDFIPTPGEGRNSLDVLVADASGHGMGAALLTGQTRAYLRGIALTSMDVGRVLDLTNHCLANDITTDHFVTAFLMRLDAGTRSLRHASAGHLPGFVLDPRGQIKAVLASTGLPLGIDPSETFPVAPAVPLEPGDVVLVVTDGITEAASPEGELFGMERTLRCVRRQQKQKACAILTALFNAVSEFCNNNHLDDLTAVIVKVDGDGRPNAGEDQRM